jgi:hypothetical protein
VNRIAFSNARQLMRNLLLMFCLLFFVIEINAQSSAVLKRKLAECNQTNQQLKYENSNLHDYQKKLITIVSNIRDSLNFEITANKNMIQYLQKTSVDSKRTHEDNDLNHIKIQKLTTELSTAERKNAALIYENELLSNPNIARIYNATLEEVKAKFMEKMESKKLDFKFEKKEENSYKINKIFDGDNEIWWITEKKTVIELEMTLKFQTHRFDRNRTVMTVNTHILEKSRGINKTLNQETDFDKIQLYQQKIIRSLEDNLKFGK